jgi:hypothetical protein
MSESPTVARVRRLAARQNLLLEKSRARRPEFLNHGSEWRLRTASGIVLMGENFSASLVDIEAFLVSVSAPAGD